jgi:hypothetical protein
MSFEPLKTDEPKAPGQEKREKEFEGQILKGSMIIGVTSVVVFILCGWPFLVIEEYRVSGLFQWAWTGALPALIVGSVAAFKFKLAGASGFAGGALASAVFIFLRMDSNLLRNFVADVAKPDYPDNWKYLIPLAWVVLSLVISVILAAGDKDFDYETPPEP